jgi:hypothetical protein
MHELITRFLESSRIDPIYFFTWIVDVLAVFLWSRLKGSLSEWRRSLYKAVIVVAIVLTAGALCKFFGLINDWKELKSIWGD